MKSKPDTNVILSCLQDIEYIKVDRPIYKSWWREIVGWNIYASSIIRTNYTIQRLRDEIESQHLPLEIREKGFGNWFQVYIV